MSDPSISTLDIFRRLAGSDLPEQQALEQATHRRRLKPGDVLFRAGETKSFVYAVNQGIIKMVYETPNGDSWVKGFAEPGICFASLTALADHGATSFSAYAEVASHVEMIEYPALQQLADRHIQWQRAMSNAYKLYGQRKEHREMELLTLSPEERYRNFLRNYPTLATVIRQRDIASYVRVTPVALSRIKSRLKASER
jgi:CRP-like cAMP-binding protein